MRSCIGVVVAVMVVITTPRAVDACSCTLPQPAVSPAHGSTDVPTNARILISFDTESVGVELRRVSSQLVIPLSFDIHQRARAYGSWQIADAVALEPNTEYELVLAPQYEGGQSRRTTFTTGTTTDVTPSTFAGIESLSLETMTYPIAGKDGGFCHSSCVETGGSGHVSRIRVEHADLPSDVALLVFELLRESDRTVVDQVPMYPRGFGDIRELGIGTCERRAPVLDPGEHYCGRLTAYDVAGNKSGHTVEVCGDAAACKPIATTNGCEPERGCVREPIPTPSSGCATNRSTTSGLLAIVLFAATRRRQRRRATPS